MFLSNWYKMFAVNQIWEANRIKARTVKDTEVQLTYNMTNFMGYGMTGNSFCTPSLHSAKTNYDTYGGVVFGTGDTPPTIDDFKLSGDMITGFNSSASVSSEVTDNGTKTTAVYTITNTGTEPFTIKEIGMFAHWNNSSGAASAILYERTVLDSPVTIEPGGVGQVTYTIEFKYPTA